MVFSVGYHLRTRPDNSVAQQDGFVSSLVLCVFVLSMGVSLCLSHWMTVGHQLLFIDTITVNGMLILLMLLSLGGMVVFTCYNSDTGQNGHASGGDARVNNNNTSRETGIESTIRKSLPQIGICLFYVAGAFLDLLRGVSHLSCIHSFWLCGGRVFASYVILIIFQIVRLIFMGLEMIFCVHFHNKRFQSCCARRYSLVLILTTTVVLWFESILYDSSEMFPTDETDRDRCTLGVRNLSDFVPQCINWTTSLYQLTENASPFLYPLNIEFLILAGEVVCTLFLNMDTRQQEGNSILRSRHPEVSQGFYVV